jgi:hypothetical protein
MKTKKSKIVAILLLATLILTTNLSGDYVYAEDWEDWVSCIHNFEYYSGGIYYLNLGDSGHFILKDITYKCSKCGWEDEDFYEGEKSHTLRGNNWHSGTKHYYQNKCAYCEYSHTTSWACSGPPCFTPNKVNLSKD